MDSKGVRSSRASALHACVGVLLLGFIGCGGTTPQTATPPPAPAAAPREVVVTARPEPVTPVLPGGVAGALALYEVKRWDAAVPALTDAAAANPRIAPFLRLRIVTAEEARGNDRAAAAVASEIIALGDTTAATVARLRLPAIYARLGDQASTDAAHAQAMQVAIDELTESDFVDLAKRLASAGRQDLANAIRMRLLNDYTSGRFTEQTYGFLSSELDRLSLDASVSLAQKLARANRYDQTLDLLERTAKRFPDAQTQELYRATRQRALFNSRNYSTLTTEEAQLADPSLILLRARGAWRDDKPQEFLDGLARIEKDFPSSKEAAEAKVLRAKYHVTDDVNYAKSIENLSKAIELGATGNDGENIWNLGWTYTLWGRYDDALKVYDRYIRSYPDGDYKTNSLFWSAKILDKLGRTQERDAKARQVVAEYPYSYYAYRTKELWNVFAEPAALAINVFPDVEAEVAKLNEPRFAAVRELITHGMHRDASREMKVLATKYTDNHGVQFLLADTYLAGGEPFRANTVLQRRFRDFVRHGGTNIPRRFWEILFPLPYFDEFRAEGERRGLDPYLLVSITRQESGFEPSTVSNAGAVGLMQIMPNEAARIGADGGIPNVTRESLFDPRTNIAVGAAEYSQKLARMNGNHTLAIASYNAGEEAVGRWLARTPFDDPDVFIESIPYAETKLYVKTVTRNRNEYRRIYQ